MRPHDAKPIEVEAAALKYLAKESVVRISGPVVGNPTLLICASEL